MISVDIPGRGIFSIENLVFDYNGTIAVDGEINEITKEQIKMLSKNTSIYILTADTHGTVREKCAGLPVEIKIFPGDNASEYKKEIVENLDGHTICFGNGFNDIEMFDSADLSICIMEQEGCCGALISKSDVVVRSLEDAFNLIIKKDRLRATLRG
ncbi:ATPase P [Peptacetobacter hominis]|uniref:ATPase P n=1 Tax=Peptacetobacter hominis TaxID=2743610 RepID=A0A544QVY5_9FIRM|nr:HAD hydrolase family protein [Peptacetobacter hominis]TQQ84857.1 ATPase P [Peptacetobacter hominis]